MTRSRMKWQRATAAVLMVALLSSLGLPAGAQGLRSRLSHLLGRKEALQAQIRVIRKTQYSATARLWTAQAQLAQVQGRLHAARVQLVTTQHELSVAQADLARLQKRTAQHKQDVEAHVLALYQSGTNSYLDVVLQADSFTDFANREQVVKALANQDDYMLTRLTTLDEQVAAMRDALAAKEQSRQRLVSQIASDEAVTQQKTAEVHQILAAANQKRSAAEEQLAEEESEENSVVAMMRARSRGNYTGSYQGSYHGSWSGSLLRPVSGPVTSPFGMRVHPITGVYKLHTGVDLGASTGTPIHAAAKGLVIHTGWERAYGQTVIIDHGSGVQTWYCHCSAILCSEGQLVQRGQVIARVGMTGMATGPHLHFGVLKNGSWVNPETFMG